MKNALMSLWILSFSLDQTRILKKELSVELKQTYKWTCTWLKSVTFIAIPLKEAPPIRNSISRPSYPPRQCMRSSIFPMPIAISSTLGVRGTHRPWQCPVTGDTWIHPKEKFAGSKKKTAGMSVQGPCRSIGVQSDGMVA